MANYSDTVLLNALTYLKDSSAAAEFRPDHYGALQAHLKYADIMVPNVGAIKQGENQAERVNYFKRSTGSVGSARKISLTGGYGDTAYLTPTWQTVTREFSISVKQAENNQETAARIMAHQIKNTVLDLYADLESKAITALQASVNTAAGNRSGLGTWATDTYTMKIANANIDNYFNYIKTDMLADKWNGLLQVVNSPNIQSMIAKQTAQGAGNSTNLQFQYPGLEFSLTNSATVASDLFGLSYVIPQGTISAITWIPQANRRGTVAGISSWTSMPDPFGLLGQLAVYREDAAADTSLTGGTAQDAVYKYEISVDITFLAVSLTTGKVVYRYGLLSS